MVWVEVDQSQFQDIEPILDNEEAEDSMRTEKLLAKGREDKTSIVEYSITIYYTKEFKESTADPVVFAEQVLSETNQVELQRRFFDFSSMIL